MILLLEKYSLLIEQRNGGTKEPRNQGTDIQPIIVIAFKCLVFGHFLKSLDKYSLLRKQRNNKTILIVLEVTKNN